MKAIVIGAGVAGTSAAIALQKAGIQAAVFEATRQGGEGVGAYLTLAVNGLRALQAIDVGAVQLGGFETPRMALHLANGRQLVEFDYGPQQPIELRSRTIKRGELYGALRDEAIRRGATIEYGKRLDTVSQLSSGQVEARFADGTVVGGDLLVGADGLGSRVRANIDSKAPRARYAGLLNTGGYATGIDVPGAKGVMQMFFGKRCFFCYIPHPNGEVLWFANPARKRESSKAELTAITPEEWRAELHRLFAADATPAAQIIRATPVIFRPWNTYDFPCVPVWHRGRMIIIGDAAHAASPSSGQGASMAIEDAVVLAKCLRDTDSAESAFALYEHMRRERVERIVAQGKRTGDGKTPNTLARVARDLVLRWIFRRSRARGDDPFKWIFDYHLEWEGRLVKL